MIQFLLGIFIIVSTLALLNKYILQYRLVRMLVCTLFFNIFDGLNLIAIRDIVGVIFIIDSVIFIFKLFSYILEVKRELK